jgi:hypothetical protein
MAPKRTAKAKLRGKRKSKAPKRSVARSRKLTAGGGPITLEEAQALALARRPGRALRKAATTLDPANPRTVGEAREELEKERRQEREQRFREYKATMTVMKERGAKDTGPQASAVGRRGARTTATASAASFVPLQIFAEGDSWFDYPPFLIKRGVIKRLQKRLGVPILNLAMAGDEVRFMLGVEQRIRLMQLLTDGCPAGGPWEALLFSGGGNDIVDNPMALWLRDFNPSLPPAAQINQPRFDSALALVRAGYEDLIDLRNQLSPGTHLFFHAYDFAFPDGRGVCTLGPWLEPAFKLRKFPPFEPGNPVGPGHAVVKEMLTQFATMLTGLEAADPKKKITFIDTHRTLAPAPSSWDNELHPNGDGFDLFAELFHKEVEAVFPGRVLKP